MNRRKLLQLAGLGVLAHRDAFASPACPASVAGLPGQSIETLNIGDAIDLKLDSAEVLPRPLWSRMTSEDRTRVKQAYAALFKADPAQPASMAHQARMHQFYCGVHDGEEHPVVPGVPTGIHGNANFLPWHRAFLYFHERMLQAALGEVPGKSKFRLPVWDWEIDGTIPDPFLAFGGSNGPGISRCRNNIKIDTCILQSWLTGEKPEDFLGTRTSGKKAAAGAHSMVHLQVGGTMKSLSTAAFDPVFYAHHANVDRFWSFWRNHPNTSAGDIWLDDPPFYLYDEKARMVRVRASETADTGKLGYCYPKPQVNLYLADSISARIEAPGKLSFNPFDWLKLERLLKAENWGAMVFRSFKSRPGLLAFLEQQLSQFTGLSLPVTADINVAFIQPGKYYLVALRAPGSGEPARLGGFGVFGGSHGQSKVSASLCLNAKALAMLWASVLGVPGIELIYGEADAMGNVSDIGKVVNGKPFPAELFQISFPKQVQDLYHVAHGQG